VSAPAPGLGGNPGGSPEETAFAGHEDLASKVRLAGDALLALGQSGNPALASVLGRLVEVLATEASRNPRFARAMDQALRGSANGSDGSRAEQSGARRSHRRSPGVIDPFAVFGDSGEAGLRDSLAALSLEQLRDIVAEHGMDNDRLAMRWKDPSRVIDRIVERVIARTAKGSAFRGRPDELATQEVTRGQDPDPQVD